MKKTKPCRYAMDMYGYSYYVLNYAERTVQYSVRCTSNDHDLVATPAHKTYIYIESKKYYAYTLQYYYVRILFLIL